MTIQKAAEFNTFVGDLVPSKVPIKTTAAARDVLKTMLKDVEGSLSVTSSTLSGARRKVESLEQEWGDLEDARIAIGDAIKALDGDS